MLLNTFQGAGHSPCWTPGSASAHTYLERNTKKIKSTPPEVQCVWACRETVATKEMATSFNVSFQQACTHCMHDSKDMQHMQET
jgi:hypothetical protein